VRGSSNSKGREDRSRTRRGATQTTANTTSTSAQVGGRFRQHASCCGCNKDLSRTVVCKRCFLLLLLLYTA
jgi:hypothetical protein